MTSARFLIGDVRDMLDTLPDASVDLVLTSPPFLALRSYLPPDHPDKAREIGSEPTPAEFLRTLLDLTVEWRRVLAPHGSIAIELGDTYAGSGGAGGDYNDGGLRQGQNGFTGSARRDRVEQPRQWSGGLGWPLGKSLCFIPQLYGASLAYGRNLLDPSQEFEPWRVRNLVRWVRPNPPVGALGDKFRPATSDITVACTARDRWFDLDAVRVPFTGHPGVGTGKRKGQDGAQRHDNRPDNMPTRKNTHDGAPPLDWWEITTEPYAGSHYATWPSALLVRPVLAMCPLRVCTICGEPSRRLTEPSEEYSKVMGRSIFPKNETTHDRERRGRRGAHGHHTAEYSTVGWTDCGHDSWRQGVVLDPFAGVGTTLAVATGHGRDAIGIDLDERNADLARERVGMFLDVEDRRRVLVPDHHDQEQ